MLRWNTPKTSEQNQLTFIAPILFETDTLNLSDAYDVIALGLVRDLWAIPRDTDNA